MSDFEFFDNKPHQKRTPSVTIDTYGRIYLSTSAREMMKINGIKTDLLIGYEKSTKKLGLARPQVVKMEETRPIIIDKRGYGSIKSFLHYFGIDYSETKRYIYTGKWNGIYMFEKEGDAPEVYTDATLS